LAVPGIMTAGAATIRAVIAGTLIPITKMTMTAMAARIATLIADQMVITTSAMAVAMAIAAIRFATVAGGPTRRPATAVTSRRIAVAPTRNRAAVSALVRPVGLNPGATTATANAGNRGGMGHAAAVLIKAQAIENRLIKKKIPGL